MSTTQAAPNEVKIVLDHEKTTPGTYRFKERIPQGGSAVLNTLYVKKTALGSTPPASITVTIVPGDGNNA